VIIKLLPPLGFEPYLQLAGNLTITAQWLLGKLNTAVIENLFYCGTSLLTSSTAV